MFLCEGSEGEEGGRKEIAFNIKDEEGNDVTNDFSVGIKYDDPNIPCTDGCDKDSEGVCRCEDLGLFDVGAQMKNLFANSNIAKLTNLSSLLTWKFFTDTIIHILLWLHVWLALSARYLWKNRHREKCIYKNYLKKREENKVEIKSKEKFWTSFKILSSFLNIYLFEDPKITKMSRLFMYYNQVITYMTFSAMFRTQENRTGMFLGINPYLVALPFLFVLPI